MKVSTNNTRKILFYFFVAISFIAILIYNLITPMMSDELLTDNSIYTGVGSFLAAEVENYMTWNGRSVLQIIMRFFLLFPKSVFNIGNSICFVLVTLFMYWNIDGRKKYDYFIYALIVLMTWKFTAAFGQSVLWESGACNYLWGVFIILGFITYYRHRLKLVEVRKDSILLAIGMFLLGVLAGWCNENTSGGGILIILYCFVKYNLNNKNNKNKKRHSWMISGIAGQWLGFIIMVLAPGNRKRSIAVLETEENTGILRYIGRFLKLNNATKEYLFPMMVITIILLAYLIIKGKKFVEIDNSIVFMISGIATIYALIMTVTPMDRAFMGATILMIVSCAQAICYIPKDEKLLQAIKYGGVICFAIFMFFLYCAEGANLMRINRELNEREAYVEEQKALGNYDLTLPMLRPNWETSYTFIYKNDIDEEPGSWGNTLYCKYYGLNSVIGVPREDWTEY